MPFVLRARIAMPHTKAITKATTIRSEGMMLMQTVLLHPCPLRQKSSTTAVTVATPFTQQEQTASKSVGQR